MKVFKYWILIISLLLPILILFAGDVGISSKISNGIFGIIFLFPFFTYSIRKKCFLKLSGYSLVLFVSFILVLFNIIFSTELINSLIYWIIYILFIYGLNSWLVFLKKNNEFNAFIIFIKEKVGYYLLLNLIVIYIGLFVFNYGNPKTYNSFGIIAGSAILYFWFAKVKIKKKILILVVISFFLFVSGSRSSLLFALISVFLTELILIKTNIKRKIFSIVIVLSFLAFFMDKLILWFSEKEQGNGLNVNNLGALISLNKDRSDLINQFLRVYSDNFFTGYGVNTSYQNLADWNVVDNISVHNGILEMILVIGIPLSIIFMYFFIIGFIKTIKITRKNRSYTTILGFSVYCFIRSYGESYFLLNIGNLMSIIFIIILVVMYSVSKKYEI